VTDNDTPPNTYIQSATRTNEWRTAIAADNATGTITITVTYTGGSDTYDVTLSDTFCGVPADTPTYNVEVDPACEYDIEMREYTLTALISGDLDGVERVYDSLATSTNYGGPLDGTYSRVIDEDNDGEIPTQSVSFTALMDNGETFSSSLDISPTNCGKNYYVYIFDPVCAYDSKSGYAYLEVTLVGDSYELAAVASITDSVGAAKTPFVKVSDDTWRTSQWLPDNGTSEVTFSGSLAAGLNGAVYPYEATYNDGLGITDCGYVGPQKTSTACVDNGLSFTFTFRFTTQSGQKVVGMGETEATGHADVTKYVEDSTNVWKVTLTEAEIYNAKYGGTTFLAPFDGRGLSTGANTDFKQLVDGGACKRV